MELLAGGGRERAARIRAQRRLALRGRREEEGRGPRAHVAYLFRDGRNGCVRPPGNYLCASLARPLRAPFLHSLARARGNVAGLKVAQRARDAVRVGRSQSSGPDGRQGRRNVRTYARAYGNIAHSPRLDCSRTARRACTLGSVLGLGRAARRPVCGAPGRRAQEWEKGGSKGNQWADAGGDQGRGPAQTGRVETGGGRAVCAVSAALSPPVAGHYSTTPGWEREVARLARNPSRRPRGRRAPRGLDS